MTDAVVFVATNGDSFAHMSGNGGTRTLCGSLAAGLYGEISGLTSVCPDCRYAHMVTCGICGEALRESDTATYGHMWFCKWHPGDEMIARATAPRKDAP
jgi:hypothetical protein